MTTKTNVAYAQAIGIAVDLCNHLAICCRRIEIAGSIRRQTATVGDIELVCVPDTYAIPSTLFETVEQSRLDDWFGAAGITPTKDGARYKQFAWQGLQVDLFVATPKNYGYIFMLRTGPADFARSMVTPAPYGLKPPTVNVRDGFVYNYPANQRLAVPDEAALFALWGMDYIAPSDRR